MCMQINAACQMQHYGMLHGLDLLVIGLMCKATPWLPASNAHPAHAKVLPKEGAVAFA